ncbi:unnamed protein product [Clavelina lepadiformis]|uniref:Uncharacterized protein n=1 Tax=Clavelina lepadiformis TaxID=159417 RepID=A0ABP0FQM0_CLALP
MENAKRQNLSSNCDVFDLNVISNHRWQKKKAKKKKNRNRLYLLYFPRLEQNPDRTEQKPDWRRWPSWDDEHFVFKFFLNLNSRHLYLIYISNAIAGMSINLKTCST